MDWNAEGGASSSRSWPLFQSLAGWRLGDLGPDVIAGLTLAAIAAPEQMATARLGGFTPEIGFLALIAGALGFAAFGANRTLSVGADSTITPIFAGALTIVVATSPGNYAAAAAALALMVGAILMIGGALRLGWVADLLSIPVTTGFLAGIAGHIALSQAPALLGVAPPHGTFLDRIGALVLALPTTNALTLLIGFGVLAIMIAGERISPRVPGALLGLGGATALAVALGLEARGVATLGAVAAATPKLQWPVVSLDEATRMAPAAFIVAVVVMVQTAATTRAFPGDAGEPNVNRDFSGVGAANILAGLIGAFPVNASPPRTAVVAETGGVSQLGALVCAGLILALSLFGGRLLALVPQAALAGVLLFIAMRIIRIVTFADVWRRSLAEFGLIVATMAAILLMPIQQGVAMGVILSLLHGVWTTMQARAVEFARIPGTTIWWPKTDGEAAETFPGVIVVALQAPLSFLNAYDFQRAILRLAAGRSPKTRLVVIEADSIVEIDYTAAKVLAGVIERLRGQKIDVAFARLESVRAQEAFRRLGLERLIGADHIFRSVEEALRALAPQKPV